MRRAALAAAALLAAVLAWYWWPGEERAIRSRLDRLAADLDAPAEDPVAAVVRARQLAGYFTEDVVVEPGGGAPPIAGRSRLLGMAARLERRTERAGLTFEDVSVSFERGEGTADVSLTATFEQTDPASGARTRDAREFQVEMTKVSGTWVIARVTAVDTLR